MSNNNDDMLHLRPPVKEELLDFWRPLTLEQLRIVPEAGTWKQIHIEQRNVAPEN